MGRPIFNNLRLSLAILAACASAGWAQLPKTLTLEQAKALALRNHPRIHGAGQLAEAVNTTVAQARAPYYPTVTGNLTGAGSPDNAAVAAGALTTSSLSSRLATGLMASQMITDFGRTSSLTATARLRAAAQSRSVDTTSRITRRWARRQCCGRRRRRWRIGA
jgi:outer membrane protein TolC